MLFTGEAAQANVPRMYYENFSKHITSKWQVVLEGWPLNKFISPSSLVTKNEVEILYNAWKTGAAKFRRLSDVEWQLWDDAHFQDMLGINVHDVEEGINDNIVVNNRFSATDNNTTSSVPTFGAPTPSTNSVPSPLAPVPSNSINIPSSSASATLGTPFFVNTTGDTGKAPRKARRDKGQTRKAHNKLAGVTTVDGTSIEVLKKPRKSRSDKGLKRGTRKGKENT